MRIKFSIQCDIRKEETEQAVKEVLFRCMLKMHELAVMNCPVDTGRLRASINISPQTPGYKEYMLSDGVDYGIHVEYGTSPHYVSPEHLKSWARRVLHDEGAAFPVAKKIAMIGVEAQPFMRPALDQVKAIWIKKYFDQVLKKATRFK